MVQLLARSFRLIDELDKSDADYDVVHPNDTGSTAQPVFDT